MASPPSEKNVGKAKAAQALRLGQAGAFGKRKRCVKGKSCGASCISYGKTCLVDLPWVGQAAMGKMVKEIKKTAPKKSSFVPLSIINPKTKKARESIKEVFDNLNQQESQGKTTTIDGILKESEIKWKNSFGQGVQAVGSGSFAAFATVPAERLGQGLGKYKDGVGVKAGQIGQEEVKVLDKLGKLDLGPKLIGAKVGGFKPLPEWGGLKVAQGMVAMTKVPGTAFYSIISPTEADKESVWKSWVAMHRAGIAHNDAHGGNILVDKAGDGKTRFVDLGLAQNNFKAALSEALGVAGRVSYTLDSDMFSSPSFSKVESNLARVKDQMRKDGFDQNHINHFLKSGDQNSLGFYNIDQWAKMSEGQASKYIDVLYEGV